MLSPLRNALRTARDSLADAARITPGWLLLCAALVLIEAALPGAQVVLLERPDRRPASGGRLGAAALA